MSGGVYAAFRSTPPSDHEQQLGHDIEAFMRSSGWFFENQKHTSDRASAFSTVSEICEQWARDQIQSSSVDTDVGHVLQLLTFGSYRLNCFLPGADIDSLCVVASHPQIPITRDRFFEGIVSRLGACTHVQNIVPKTTALVPVVSFDCMGVEFDIGFAKLHVRELPFDIDLRANHFLNNLDERSTRSINGPRVTQEVIHQVPPQIKRSFQFALRCIKLWAKRRLVYGNAIALLPGVALEILLAMCAQMCPSASSVYSLLRSFFEIYASWDWKNLDVKLNVVSVPSSMSSLPPDPSVYDPANPVHSRQPLRIITPVYPPSNTTSRVTELHMECIVEEFQRGLALFKQMEESQRSPPLPLQGALSEDVGVKREREEDSIGHQPPAVKVKQENGEAADVKVKQETGEAAGVKVKLENGVVPAPGLNKEEEKSSLGVKVKLEAGTAEDSSAAESGEKEEKPTESTVEHEVPSKANESGKGETVDDETSHVGRLFQKLLQPMDFFARYELYVQLSTTTKPAQVDAGLKQQIMNTLMSCINELKSEPGSNIIGAHPLNAVLDEPQEMQESTIQDGKLNVQEVTDVKFCYFIGLEAKDDVRGECKVKQSNCKTFRRRPTAADEPLIDEVSLSTRKCFQAGCGHPASRHKMQMQINLDNPMKKYMSGMVTRLTKRGIKDFDAKYSIITRKRLPPWVREEFSSRMLKMLDRCPEAGEPGDEVGVASATTTSATDLPSEQTSQAEGTHLPEDTSADSGSGEEFKSMQLKPLEVIQIDSSVVSSSSATTIRLVDGDCEVFGAELVPSTDIVFKTGSVSLQSLKGCTLEVKRSGADGQVLEDPTIYHSNFTNELLNTHGNITAMRRAALAQGKMGPTVAVVGPKLCGKTTVCRTLLNYALRTGHNPIYVDTDVSSCRIAMPGSIACARLAKPILPNSNACWRDSFEPPFAFFYGDEKLGSNVELYNRYTKLLSEGVRDRQAHESNEIKSSGLIIDTPEFSQGTDKGPLLEALKQFEVDLVLVIGAGDKLFSKIKSDLERTLGSASRVVRLEHADTDLQQIRDLSKELKRSYFYGDILQPLQPQDNRIICNDIKLWRIGDASRIRAGSRPMDHTGTENDASMSVNEVSTGTEHKTQVLAVLDVPEDASNEQIARASVRGYVWVKQVFNGGESLILLQPQASLPAAASTGGGKRAKHLSLGRVKWYNQ